MIQTTNFLKLIVFDHVKERKVSSAFIIPTQRLYLGGID